MNKVVALFNYETVKKAVKLHYQNSDIDFMELDKMPDDDNCLVYLDCFSNMLKKYGVDDNSVMLKKNN